MKFLTQGRLYRKDGHYWEISIITKNTSFIGALTELEYLMKLWAYLGGRFGIDSIKSDAVSWEDNSLVTIDLTSPEMVITGDQEKFQIFLQTALKP